ncbi:sensor histidine kinase [Brevundimonas sp.]|uniref:sensor histidine kinase n=1 Tax=Brevundimonas sp. TaxID=1871086 RepID=UPI0027318FB9|nr:histidine kinase [Brevundimonas sp.]MDP1912227.1 histidine kinase [Brevundimonas sp.]
MLSKTIDWSQLWYPGPKRAFSPDEMARAGSDRPSATLLVMAAINFAAVAFVMLQLVPAPHTARLSAALVALAAMGSVAARWLWWRPWRRPLALATLGVLGAMLLLSLGMRWRVPAQADRYPVALAFSIGGAALVVALWFLVVWRAQQIEARLREQAEREAAIEMARRLAAAQLEPHFLFNTLASVQHWVQTKDDRAAPLLAALTGYLRATLPMFNRALIPAGDELVAVEGYLQVMQARMGVARLSWRIDVDDPLRTLPLPPGLLLTLVENALEHGVEPRVGGGEVLLTLRRHAEEAVFVVQDNGPGPSAEMAEGAGLANLRQRLELTCGGQARLSIEAAPGGGCRAEVRLPWRGPLP